MDKNIETAGLLWSKKPIFTRAWHKVKVLPRHNASGFKEPHIRACKGSIVDSEIRYNHGDASLGLIFLILFTVKLPKYYYSLIDDKIKIRHLFFSFHAKFYMNKKSIVVLLNEHYGNSGYGILRLATQN